jgi:uncharacterized membrane protein YjgN (DUF898 family)
MKKLGKVLIGVGFCLIGIPLVVAILYVLGFSNPFFVFLRGIVNFFSQLPLNIFHRWLGVLVYYPNRIAGAVLNTDMLRTSVFLSYPFLWNFLFLFLPNVFIISGFTLLTNQNQKIEIKKCFNLLVIIGLAINIIVLLNFFGFYSSRIYRRSFYFNLTRIVDRITFYRGWQGINTIILYIRWILFSLSYLLLTIIPVLPTFIITAGYMKFFKKEETESNEVVSIADKKVSYFDGGLLSYVGWKILGFFITIFTLGICYPWSLCMVYGWKVNHTTIDGKRLKFNGKALSLLGNWILWGFLTIITLGIFGFWRSIFLKKWIVKNTSLVEPNGIEKPLSTDTASYFDGGLASYVGWKILGFIINVFTLGICYPWSLCMVYGWEINHSVIEGKRQKFNGKALSLLGHWILWIFLLVITLGIYGFWLSIALEKWKVKNTTFEGSAKAPVAEIVERT